MGGAPGEALRQLASAGFYDGLQAGCLVAAGVCFVGSIMVAALLPSKPAEAEAEGDAQPHSAELALEPA